MVKIFDTINLLQNIVKLQVGFLNFVHDFYFVAGPSMELLRIYNINIVFKLNNNNFCYKPNSELLTSCKLKHLSRMQSREGMLSGNLSSKCNITLKYVGKLAFLCHSNK